MLRLPVHAYMVALRCDSLSYAASANPYVAEVTHAALCSALCLANQGEDDRVARRVDRNADAQLGERDGARANHHNDHAEGAGGGGGSKRPASALGAEDQDGRKRVRRLLGRALLGTLQKFRQEDAQFNVRSCRSREHDCICRQGWGMLGVSACGFLGV